MKGSAGTALGQALLTVRFSGESKLDLASLASRKGLVSAHLLRNIAHPPAQTIEQKLRGGDAAPDWIALVSGYSAEAVASVAGELKGVAGLYRLAYILAATEEA